MTTFSNRRAVDPTLELHVTKHSHHTCRLCAGGCRSYDVMLTELEARRLDLDMWRPLLNEVPADEPLVLLDEATHQYTLNKVADRCVFLDTDNLCIIHKSAGMAAKPIACQFFPFQAVQAPDGLHVSLNVGCRRLVEMTDADDIPDTAVARRLLTEVQSITTIGETLPLTPDIIVSYSEFTAWQDQLIAILTVPEADWAHTWNHWRDAARLLLEIPADEPPQTLDGLNLFHTLHTLTTQTPPVRHTLSALYQRCEGWLSAINVHGSQQGEHTLLASISTFSDAPAAFCASVARQQLEGQQAALHRTARTGWVALLAALIGGAYGAPLRVELRADHALNESISDAVDLFLSPAGQLALTEPAQQAFLRTVSL